MIYLLIAALVAALAGLGLREYNRAERYAAALREVAEAGKGSSSGTARRLARIAGEAL